MAPPPSEYTRSRLRVMRVDFSQHGGECLRSRPDCGRLHGTHRHGGKRRIRPQRIGTLKQASRWKGG